MKLIRLPFITLFFSSIVLSSAQAQYPERPYPITEEREPCLDFTATKRPFFGDTHVHTALSFDAASQDTRNRPADAYRFAKGGAMGIQPYDDDGNALRTIQLSRPLDFTAVTDHAEFMGEVNICRTPGSKGYWHPACVLVRNWAESSFYVFGAKGLTGKSRWGFCGDNYENCFEHARSVWAEVVEAAETAYDRSENCSFTSFPAYEWTSTVGAGKNLHRNVIFRNQQVPARPPSWIDTASAVDLWDDLQKNCVDGVERCDALTIPHNSNLSAGLMFQNAALENDKGMDEPTSAEQLARRARWEPLIEVMQHKGSSECDSRTFWVEDEFCDFEKMGYDSFGGKNTGDLDTDGPIGKLMSALTGIETPKSLVPDPSNFIRYALKKGLQQQAELGVNSFKYGLISATDTHIAAPGLTAEKNHPGHGGAGMGARDGVQGLPDELEYSPGGLTVLWAEENTRDALFAAMQRREAYATSGTRPTVRLFAGWDYEAAMCGDNEMISKAYASGVPMGADMQAAPADDAKPKLLVAATMDAGSQLSPGNPLQRIQIVKGWYENGELNEQVIDVAGGPNDATVDVNTCATSGSGHTSLCTVWTDENFDSSQEAFYYTRVLENPSCRWSQYICLAEKVDCSNPDTVGPGLENCCSPDHKRTQQERAWSSPIWYTP